MAAYSAECPVSPLEVTEYRRGHRAPGEHETRLLHLEETDGLRGGGQSVHLFRETWPDQRESAEEGLEGEQRLPVHLLRLQVGPETMSGQCPGHQGLLVAQPLRQDQLSRHQKLPGHQPRRPSHQSHLRHRPVLPPLLRPLRQQTAG